MKARYTNLKQRTYTTYRTVTINNLPKVEIVETVVPRQRGMGGWLLVGVAVAGVIGKLMIIGII